MYAIGLLRECPSPGLETRARARALLARGGKSGARSQLWRVTVDGVASRVEEEQCVSWELKGIGRKPMG